MHPPSISPRPVRLLLVALVVAMIGSFATAATPPTGSAAERSPEPVTQASPSVEPSLEPFVEPTPSGTPTLPPSATPSLPPSATPTLPPSATPTLPPPPAPTPTPTPKPTATPTPRPSPSAGPAPAAAPVWPATYPSHCVTWSTPIENANLLLENRYRLQTHPVAQLGANPTWTENPFGDDNWRFLHHSLGTVQQLMQAYSMTLDLRYRDKAIFLMKDWLADNPRSNPASPWAWNDHAAALRANAFTCAALYLPMEPWLQSGLNLHGTVLADPGFYVYQGNHALDQSLGLLEVGGTLGRTDWMTLARDRIAILLPASVDTQGVTNEQSVTYQGYNLRRYRLAEQRLRAWGQAVPSSFSRVALMPNLLAHATRPDLRYEMLGDTPLNTAGAIRGTIAEYAATGGKSGPRPSATTAVYSAGFLFTRTSWVPTAQPYADQRLMSLRFGPAPILHGHADGGAVSLYGYGTSLLIDPGGYTYTPSIWRSYFKGRSAHNVVMVDGVTWNLRSHTTLVAHRHSTTMTYAEVYQPGNSGTSHIRSTVFSKRLGYVLVDDRLASSTVRTYRQLWHLPADGKPLVRSTFFNSQRGRGNIQVRQLVGGSTSRVVLGQTAPVQGWTSYLFGQKAPAPVVEVRKSGTSARYVTLLSTHAGAPATTVTGFRLTSDGYRVTVTIGGKSELVVVSGGNATITPLN